MFKDFDVNIIDKYLKEKFPIIFDFEFDGIILLIGGTIKDLMMGKDKSKDLDFTLLTQGTGNIKEFIKKYNLNVIGEIVGGYAIKYNDQFICMKALNDLYDAGHLSTDFLFYDIKRKILIPFGIRRSIEKNEIIDCYYQGYFRSINRLKKAKVFLTYLNHKKHHRIKYNYNRPYQLLLAFLRNPKKLFKKNR